MLGVICKKCGSASVSEYLKKGQFFCQKCYNIFSVDIEPGVDSSTNKKVPRYDVEHFLEEVEKTTTKVNAEKRAESEASAKIVYDILQARLSPRYYEINSAIMANAEKGKTYLEVNFSEEDNHFRPITVITVTDDDNLYIPEMGDNSEKAILCYFVKEYYDKLGFSVYNGNNYVRINWRDAQERETALLAEREEDQKIQGIVNRIKHVKIVGTVVIPENQSVMHSIRIEYSDGNIGFMTIPEKEKLFQRLISKIVE